MKKEKIMKYLDYSAKAIFTICIIAVCIMQFVKPREEILRGNGYEIRKSQNESDISFLILQKEGERLNEVNTMKSFLNQNNMEYRYVKFKDENSLQNAEENLKKELSDEEIIVISHFKDYGEYLNDLNIKGKILCSPKDTEEKELPLLLVSTASDRECSTADVIGLYNKLTDSHINSTGFGVNAEKDHISMKIVSKAFGSLSGLSEDYIKAVNMWLRDKFEMELRYKNYYFAKLLILAAAVVSACISYVLYRPAVSDDSTVYRLVSIKSNGIFKYFLARVLIFIAGIPICGIFIGAVALIPFLDFNTANILSAYLFSAGIVNFALYKSGKMPGIVGKISSKDIIASNSKQSFKTLLILLSCLIPMIMSSLLGIGELTISAEYIPQFLFCFVTAFMGYYSYNLENMVLSQTDQGRAVKIIVGISPFLPMLIIAFAGIPFGNPTWIYMGIIDIIGIFTVTMAGSAAAKINNHIVFTSFLEALICSGFLSFIRFA